MAVEIRILSGARQGQTVRLDKKEFHAGAEPGYEVHFDPVQDPTARDRGVWFFLRDDGWQARHVGVGEVLVNSERLAGTLRIRSGDVVRLSEQGPDFVFRIVTRPASVVESVPPPPVPSSPAPPALEPVPATLAPPPAASVPAAPPASAGAPPVSAGPPAASDANRTLLMVFGGIGLTLVLLIGVVLVVVVLAVVLLLRSPRQDAGSPSANKPIAGSISTGTSTSGSANAGPSISATANTSTTTPGSTNPGSSTTGSAGAGSTTGGAVVDAKPPFAGMAEELRDAVYLLKVEKGDFQCPHATAFAVSDDTLITTAREAAQLARLQRDQQYKIYATQQKGGVKLEVREIRLNAVFATLAEKPTDWIYFNLALLKVEGKLPKKLTMATPADLAELRAGLPLAAFGYTHQAEKITEFDKFEPQLAIGKVYIITTPPNLPGTPRLVHFRGPVPSSAYGTPLVNRQGRVVAIFGEADPASTSAAANQVAALKDLYLATVLNPETVELGLQQPDAKLWTLPTPAAAPAAAPQP